MSGSLEPRWSLETEAFLRSSGWYPGRRVETREWEEQLLRYDNFQLHEPARKFLEEFGGLEIRASGPGMTMARQYVLLDPTRAVDEQERFTEYSTKIGSSLYPVGEVEHGHTFLALDEHGAAYLLMDFILPIGRSGDEALENLIEGINPSQPA